jgi:coenzyme F420-reducing hydrogenase beta subunit
MVLGTYKKLLQQEQPINKIQKLAQDGGIVSVYSAMPNEGIIDGL